MTVEREPSGVRRAVCDACGDELWLDAEGDREEADEELRERGWTARPVDVVRYPSDYSGTRNLRVEYHEHDCPDCGLPPDGLRVMPPK